MTELLELSKDPGERIQTLKDHGVIYNKNEGKENKDGDTAPEKYAISPYDMAQFLNKVFSVKYLNESYYFYDKNKGIYIKENSDVLKSITVELLTMAMFKKLFTRTVMLETKHCVESNCLVKDEDLKKAETLIAVNNGLIDCYTGEMMPFTHEVFITNKLDLIYDQQAECPMWLEYLKTTFSDNKEIIDFYQEVWGYTLHKGMPIKSLFMHIGPPDSGKTQGLHVFDEMLGTSRNVAYISLDKFDDPTYINGLYGKMANVDFEIKDLKEALECGNLKKASGGQDKITERSAYAKEPMGFTNFAKLHFVMNEFPKIKDATGAVYKRIYVIEYPNSFDVDSPTTVKELGEKILENDKSGIFNWMMTGYRRLVDNGFIFNYPENLNSIKEGRRKEYNSIYAFITDMTVKTGNPDDRIYLADLYLKYYGDYMAENFPHVKEWHRAKSARDFGMKVKSVFGGSVIIPQNRYYLNGYIVKSKNEMPAGVLYDEENDYNMTMKLEKTEEKVTEKVVVPAIKQAESFKDRYIPEPFIDGSSDGNPFFRSDV